MPLFDPYGMCAGRGLFRATPIVTSYLGFRSLTQWNLPWTLSRGTYRTLSNPGPQGRQINVKKKYLSWKLFRVDHVIWNFSSSWKWIHLCFFHNNKKQWTLHNLLLWFDKHNYLYLSGRPSGLYRFGSPPFRPHTFASWSRAVSSGPCPLSLLW